jgi:DNA-binding PadR family transcriptional regulator
MTAVFSHGRLRLYLLKLLAEGPKHGYELIRLLENRFLGLYAPSAGTIYPRLARMESEGLITHTAAGGRKTYEITAAGRAELADRADELADLETEIHASVADLSSLANHIEREVRGSVRDIKRELRDATSRVRASGRPPWASRRPDPPEGTDREPALSDLERVIAELAGEVRRMARDSGVGERELRAASAVVVSALTELKRLLRPR